MQRELGQPKGGGEGQLKPILTANRSCRGSGMGKGGVGPKSLIQVDSGAGGVEERWAIRTVETFWTNPRAKKGR